MKQVKDVIEEAIYISIRDRFTEQIPNAGKNKILKDFLPDLNNAISSIGKENPGVNSLQVASTDLKKDPNLKLYYVDTDQKTHFLLVYSVEYLSGERAYPLQRKGEGDFFSNYTLDRGAKGIPDFFHFNFGYKIYIYPAPTSGHINIIGKPQLGDFDTINEEFPRWVSNNFILYLQYVLAKMICAKYSTTLKPQEEEQLQTYKRRVSSECNNAYQHNTIQNYSEVGILSQNGA